MRQIFCNTAFSRYYTTSSSFQCFENCAISGATCSLWLSIFFLCAVRFGAKPHRFTSWCTCLKIFTTVVFDNMLLLNSVSAFLFRSSPYFFIKEQLRLACLQTSIFDKFLTRSMVIISYPLYIGDTSDTYDKIAFKEFFSLHVISLIKIAIHKRKEK